ncbi:TetR/AcrR family transcriptional regulator [Aquirhabdus parva]|uniref:TetR/AcrR family transcriptional regulator n=1 Tax=Aquirhabdus parva TaxID=2283318 RepID=A0A345P933_9GAMM|nr:TetR/AcrR family transcriptional regulator [Aquirhabdus parva]AXI03792.1 TetR/AcrR family transcriptional regulator [Aquirhabdus parva]
MSTIARKQRELMQRNTLLLDIAQEMLEESGFASLSLDKLAARTEFSKGTIYNHFMSKEDLLTALCVRALQIQLSLYLRVFDFPGNSREKILALHYAYNLYARQHPALFMCVLSGLAQNIVEKTSAHQMAERHTYERRVTAVLDEIVQTAMDAGDIQAPRADTVEIISFANWAMSFGTTALLQAAGRASSIERIDADTAFIRNIGVMLDGLQWRPLCKDWDYEDTWQRLHEFFGVKAGESVA